MDNWPVIAAIAAILIIIVVAALVLTRRGESGGRHASPKRPARAQFRRTDTDVPPPPKKQATFVVNPTKFDDLPAAMTQIRSVVAAHPEWDIPRIVETTADDTGAGAARDAVEAKVDLVCAVGGDGTVRSVAEVLAGTSIPMGIIPAGTGNLLSRNLDVPLDMAHGLEVALTGRNRHIDVGWVSLDPADTTPGPTGDTSPAHAFLVMAGLGLDATVMDNTSEAAKAAMGRTAYVAAGLKNLLGARFSTTLVVDGGDPIVHTARSVLVGNVGQLTGGITLMPDAQVDDGILDVVAITPKGLVGWVGVAMHVLRQRGANHPKLDRYRCQSLTISVDEPQLVEVDGDVIGSAKRVRFDVAPQALIVRTDPVSPR